MKPKSPLCGIFAKRIAEHREELKLSQSELARRMDTTPSFICDFEKGRRNPTLWTVDRFADALGVAPEELLT